MKLQEIMRSGPGMFQATARESSRADNAMMEWLDKHVTYTDTASYDSVPIGNVRVERGIIVFDNVKPTKWGHGISNEEGTKHVHMSISMEGQRFDPPVPIIHGPKIFVDDQVQIFDAIIDDWSKLPILEKSRNFDVRLAVIGAKSVIKSWNGLDAYDLNSIQINHESTESVKIECSLLPLVAIKAYFGYNAYSGNTDPLAEPLDKAFDFLYKMKRSKNANEFEFQEYLIDHGLEQFA